MFKKLKALFHIHKYKTLLIYPPHSHVCDKERCAGSNDYGFLMQCECGYNKSTKLPHTITEIFEVKSK